LQKHRLYSVEKLPVEIGVKTNFDIRSNQLNANDNFANDNFEFAPVAKAAIA